MTTRFAMPVDSSVVSVIDCAVDEILVGDRAVDLGEDRAGVGIPFGDALAALDVVALVDLEPRAVLEAVHRPLGPVLADDHHRDVAAHDDQLALGVARDVAVAHPHRAFEVRLDEGLVGDLRRAADVEGAHRELRARLADRLRRDDADRLAHVDRRAAGEIAPVAGGADAVLRLADEHRTDLHLLDAGGRDRLDVLLLDHRSGGHDHACRRRRRGPRPSSGRGCARRARRRPGRHR